MSFWAALVNVLTRPDPPPTEETVEGLRALAAATEQMAMGMRPNMRPLLRTNWLADMLRDAWEGDPRGNG